FGQYDPVLAASFQRHEHFSLDGLPPRRDRNWLPSRPDLLLAGVDTYLNLPISVGLRLIHRTDCKRDLEGEGGQALRHDHADGHDRPCGPAGPAPEREVKTDAFV